MLVITTLAGMTAADPERQMRKRHLSLSLEAPGPHVSATAVPVRTRDADWPARQPGPPGRPRPSPSWPLGLQLHERLAALSYVSVMDAGGGGP
jgi:hypothetical protein